MQHIYITRQYNTQIGKLGKKKPAFIAVIKRKHIYVDTVGIQFIQTQKTNKVKVRGNIKNLCYKQEKK